MKRRIQRSEDSRAGSEEDHPREGRRVLFADGLASELISQATSGELRKEEKPEVPRHVSQNQSINQTDCSDNRITLGQILQNSIDLDGVAKRNIEQLLALGSKRLAQDFIELLNNAVDAIDQNANLLGILRYQLGISNEE